MIEQPKFQEVQSRRVGAVFNDGVKACGIEMHVPGVKTKLYGDAVVELFLNFCCCFCRWGTVLLHLGLNEVDA